MTGEILFVFGLLADPFYIVVNIGNDTLLLCRQMHRGLSSKYSRWSNKREDKISNNFILSDLLHPLMS